ncbi:uncharacterized protein PRCAT00004560001 [Priceomyces carsonii]|uniref:uncharacterized protein n=1 Tax=Priceomyces carsonii TaxID=28549 RepID=UPI002ED865C7|nr:unnamed protein product [Priceomyces carsonii]
MINKFVLFPVLLASIALYYYVILYQDADYNEWPSIGFGNLISKNENLSLPKWSSHLKRHSPKLASNSYMDYSFPFKNRTQIGAENATIVMLVRNSELKGALESIRSLEDRFNKDYRYPWVFLNEVPFEEEFIEQTSLMVSGETYYELVPEEDWEPPSFIDERKLQEGLKKASDDGIVYGGLRSYRNMCHFNSGYFYKQKRLLNYEWYFRVEPDVQYMCDFQYDPFTLLRSNDKLYGFVIAIHEYGNTIPTLWDTVEDFMVKYPEFLHPNNAIKFITSNETTITYGFDFGTLSPNYNLCHFWSNFEVGNLNFFRSKAYNTFFDHLDKAGGFYYERWGDAPVHTIALSLLIDKNKIHHFEDIGYYHPPHMCCPASLDVIAAKRCVCKAYGPDGKILDEPVDETPFSCLSRWWRYGSGKNFLNEIDLTYN